MQVSLSMLQKIKLYKVVVVVFFLRFFFLISPNFSLFPVGMGSWFDILRQIFNGYQFVIVFKWTLCEDFKCSHVGE